MILETERLTVRKVNLKDTEAFFDMMGNPNVMNPIPRPIMTRVESDAFLNKLISDETFNSDKQVRAIVEKKSNCFIGLCAYLKNDENDDEIGYRLREQFWGIGYGTEITKGLLDFGFTEKGCVKVTADVSIENIGSTKILDKFMNPVREFYNEEDKCTDRRYELYKEDWLD
jgi:RimJ/RimL family protein N-acetyltransferase